MKKFLNKKILLIAGFTIFLFIYSLYIFLDSFYGSNFRSMEDPILSIHEVDLTGLRQLRASGGTAVRFGDLQRRLAHINGRKIIIDGMAEFHGYINGIPTPFFAYHRNENPRLKHLIRRLVFTGTTEMRPELVIPEKEEAKTHGFEYQEVSIGSKFIESDENINRLIDIFDAFPQDVWLHFHCAHGKGRTSMMLVMLDILRNASKVKLEDIVKRQHLLGSENLMDTKVWKNGTYTQKMLEDRKAFIEKFYIYARQRKASGGIRRWSEWHRQQGMNESNKALRGESQ